MGHSPAPAEAVEAFLARLRPHGLNIYGVLTGDAYDALCAPLFARAAIAPDARSAIVLASGGRALWDAIGTAPEAGERHRINRFTERVIHEAVLETLAPAAGPALCVWPTERRGGAWPPIMSLAIASGIGVPSKMALLLHPTYGLWIGLRAIVLTPLDLPATPALAPTDFDPCAKCHAPCAAVCHGNTITPDGYDGAACLATRVTNRACRRTCDARLACPVGADHQYSIEQLAHHARHLLDPATLVRYGLFAMRERVRARITRRPRK